VGNPVPGRVTGPAVDPGPAPELASGPVVEVRGLRKAYRARGWRGLRPGGLSRPALAGLDLVVPAGGVHGFLGPNGSGKTTTLRILLGLVGADAGAVRLFGAPVPGALPEVLPRVGALIESPQLFPMFSGRRNLSLLAGVAGLPASRVEEVLGQVGLAGRADDRVRTYSLGMRQRLAVGAALLKQPRLLVLDEPSNGLDPAGIREVRELLRGLAAGGTTVLLSSHLLAEVQQVCDSVTIVAQGRTVAAGAVGEVLRGTGAPGRPAAQLRVGLTDLVAGARVLAQAGLTVAPSGRHLLVSGADDPAQVSRLLGRQGLWVRELVEETADLEEVFLSLTAGGGGS
jgi:ABC-type multidrug transport system ATPase subunit